MNKILKNDEDLDFINNFIKQNDPIFSTKEKQVCIYKISNFNGFSEVFVITKYSEIFHINKDRLQSFEYFSLELVDEFDSQIYLFNLILSVRSELNSLTEEKNEIIDKMIEKIMNKNNLYP